MVEAPQLSQVEHQYPKTQGQTMVPAGETKPIFGPSQRLDFELEMAFITTDAK